MWSWARPCCWLWIWPQARLLCDYRQGQWVVGLEWVHRQDHVVGFITKSLCDHGQDYWVSLESDHQQDHVVGFKCDYGRDRLVVCCLWMWPLWCQHPVRWQQWEDCECGVWLLECQLPSVSVFWAWKHSIISLLSYYPMVTGLPTSGHINLAWLLDCQSLVATFCHGNWIVSLWSYRFCVITGVLASGLISWWRCSIAGSLASLVLRKIKIAWKSYVRDLKWAVQLEEWLCASVSETEPRDCMVPDRRF